MTRLPLHAVVAAFCFGLTPLCAAASSSSADQQDTQLLKSMADANHRNSSENNLYQGSIHANKQSIAHDTLDLFYQDAVDYYREKQYDDALELFEKIYSIDPSYKDVAEYRDKIQRLQATKQRADNREAVENLERRGDQAKRDGKNAVAVSYWKQALSVDPSYEPARKKIQEVNHALAQKQFEEGYLHYNRHEMEDALNCWSNAVALDPSYKKQGLLVLMSKVQLQVDRNEINRLIAQGSSQYERGELEDALKSYQNVLKLEPRHQDAKQMTFKIKITLGSAAFKAAQAATARGDYAQAAKEWQTCLNYDYEPVRARKGLQDAQQAMKTKPARTPTVKRPAVKSQPPPQAAVAASTPTAAEAPEPPRVKDREGALSHYRQGLMAIRNKDYHLALDELNRAHDLDPTDDQIYVALERAKQEWAASNGGSSHP